MRQQCTSIAKSTKSQCRNKAIPGSQYCVLHIEKPPLLVGAILGVILGYLINWVLPTPELRELRQLRNDVQPVISLAESSFPDLNRSEAIENLTQEVGKIRSDLKIKEDQIKEQKKEIEKVKAHQHLRKIANIYPNTREIVYTSGNRITGGMAMSNPSNITKKYDQFWKSLKKEDIKVDIDSLIEITKILPDWPYSYFYLGALTDNISYFKIAEDKFKQFREVGIVEPELLLFEAINLSYLKQYDNARKRINEIKGLNIEPKEINLFIYPQDVPQDLASEFDKIKKIVK